MTLSVVVTVGTSFSPEAFLDGSPDPLGIRLGDEDDFPETSHESPLRARLKGKLVPARPPLGDLKVNDVARLHPIVVDGTPNRFVAVYGIP